MVNEYWIIIILYIGNDVPRISFFLFDMMVFKTNINECLTNILQGIALSRHAPGKLNLRQSFSTQKNRYPSEYAPGSLRSPGAKK